MTDYPTTGSYYNEQVDMILCIDASDFVSGTFITDFWAQWSMLATKFYPYKNIVVTPVPPEQLTTSLAYVHSESITSWTIFDSECAKLSERLANTGIYVANHKFLVIWICPYWNEGAHMLSIFQVGNYIFSNAVLRHDPLAHFPIKDEGAIHHLTHECGHAFALNDSVPAIYNVDMLQETAMASGLNLTDDEKLAITHYYFNNGLNALKLIFGCRDGNEMPWIHDYVYSPQTHDQYSATWDETEPYVPTINDGSSFFTKVCPASCLQPSVNMVIN